MSTTVRCIVCKDPFKRAVVDRLLDDRMSYAGIERYANENNVPLTADVVSRHAKHYAPPPERPKGTPKRDFAIVIRDKALAQVDNGLLDLTDKDTVPGINAGLKAQSILDQREKQKTKQQSAELAFAIIEMLGGRAPAPLQIEDGLTIDGDYEEVDGETE